MKRIGFAVSGLSWFSRRPEVGTVLLRLFFGATLVYGTQDNVFDSDRMLEFREFLERHGFPMPLLSAYVSVYAQFVCGLLLLIGLAVRPAALVMVVNFVVALLMVHVGLPFSANIAPLAMLFCALFFLFHGAGPLAVDTLGTRRRAAGYGPWPIEPPQ